MSKFSKLPDSLVELHRKTCREQTDKALSNQYPMYDREGGYILITPVTIETLLNRLIPIPKD